MRVGVEFGYGATEMASEASDSERAAIFAEAARIQRLGILDTRPPPTRALRQGDA